MRKITTSEVIKRWLKDRFDLGKFEVSTHMLELQLPEYGKMYYGVIHTPSTYSRNWRKLKANVKQLEDIDVINIKVKPTGSVENTWILETYTSKQQSETLHQEIQ
jgi:hypothetical protein